MNDTTLAIRLPAELAERLREAAERDGRTPSALARHLLRQALDAKKGGQQ
jgi:predicted DNA-binding protein